MIQTENSKSDISKKSHDRVVSGGSALSRYQDLIVGSRSLKTLLYFEFCTWLTNFPGAIGLFLRKTFWPSLFGVCGKSVFFGKNITLRHPHRIFIGDRVVISDYCILDGRNDNSEKVIEIDDDV